MLRRSIGTFERLSRVRSRPPTTILPPVALELLQQQAHERRLAGAGRADDEDELALVDVERDVAQRDDVGLVDLRHGLEHDHRAGAGVGARSASTGGSARAVAVSEWDEVWFLHGGIDVGAPLTAARLVRRGSESVTALR